MPSSIRTKSSPFFPTSSRSPPQHSVTIVTIAVIPIVVVATIVVVVVVVTTTIVITIAIVITIVAIVAITADQISFVNETLLKDMEAICGGNVTL
jgi:hypothetical protein